MRRLVGLPAPLNLSIDNSAANSTWVAKINSLFGKRRTVRSGPAEDKRAPVPPVAVSIIVQIAIAWIGRTAIGSAPIGYKYQPIIVAAFTLIVQVSLTDIEKADLDVIDGRVSRLSAHAVVIFKGRYAVS